MKLKDVTHTESRGDKKFTDLFSFHNNRFLLFDKLGNELNPYALEKLDDILDAEVLETRTSHYAGWGVGFPTTHIKLDLFGNDNTFSSDNFRYEDDLDTRL